MSNRDVLNHSGHELAQSLFEESGDALILFEPETEQVLDANPMAQRLTGFSREELRAQAVNELLRAEAAEDLRRLRAAYQSTGLLHAREGYFLRDRRTAGWMPVNLSITRLHVEPKTLGLITVRDIRERLRHEEALGRSHQRLAMLRELDRVILSAQSSEDVARAAVENLRRLVPCQHVSVTWYDPERGKARPVAAAMDSPGRLAGDLLATLADLESLDPLADVPLASVEDLAGLNGPSLWQQQLLARGLRSLLRVGLTVEGELLGELTLCGSNPGAFPAECQEIARDVAEHLALAMKNARLFEQVRAGRQQLQVLTRRLVESQEAERRRIARELHDEIGQILTGLKFTLGTDADPAVAAPRRAEAQQLVDELLQRVRELSLDLRPALLDDLGLLPALQAHFQRYGRQTGIRVICKHEGVEERRLSSEVETALFRVTQEALTNAARHAGVSQLAVRLWADRKAISLEIEDQGAGFDPEAVLTAGVSTGVSGMRERLAYLGGTLTVESAPGRGARLLAELPLPAKKPSRRLRRPPPPAGPAGPEGQP